MGIFCLISCSILYNQVQNLGSVKFRIASGFSIFIISLNKFLIRQRWDVNYSRTAQMLKEVCNCEDKRIGKDKISVFRVKQFDKKEEEYPQKELKPKDVF